VATADIALPAPNSPLRKVSLADRFELEEGWVFLSAAQALARIPLLQVAADRRAGLAVRGLVTGYRGSPLGTVDTAIASAARQYEANGLVFRPGLNEELAATAVWGAQQADILGRAACDGVIGMWYAKGPGVDRAGDALKHANLAGVMPNGGVLVLAGDDHGAKSSTVAHQSEQALVAALIPILAPANVQEILDFGLHAYAMSRAAGLWVAMKLSTDTAETSSAVEVGLERVRPILPEQTSPDGVHIRARDPQLAQERRHVRHKLPAAQAYAVLNGLDRIVVDSPRRRLGIVASGKAFLDVRQAMAQLGLDDAVAHELGVRVYKPGLIWPLETSALVDFARGHEEILVVEEKRAVIEPQIAVALYNLAQAVRPVLSGKATPEGEPLLESDGETTPGMVAEVIWRRLSARGMGRPDLRAPTRSAETGSPPSLVRVPYYCAGCPHNRSTRVPDGSLALGGIGCHVMAHFMPDRPTAWPTQMGGEGCNWTGAAPFTATRHVFQNLGDGTYSHSGSLAIRAAVAAGVNITYRILYNDAVAMTGGQKVEGAFTVPEITRQLAAERVNRIVVVAEDPGRYPANAGFAPGVEVRPRRDMDAVQRELRETLGVTVIIYDQVCAAEKRRRRKRGLMPDPDVRVVINPQVCEGCGDCQKASNCVAVEPTETQFGRKRAINQSACNKDLSCTEGFCPSFVTLRGARLKRVPPAAFRLPDLPEPTLPTGERSLVIAGIGGTGVVTIGSVIGMAAHLQGAGCSVMDMTGLSQKNGAVSTHVRIGADVAAARSARLDTGEADAILACDVVAASAPEIRRLLSQAKTAGVLNESRAVTAQFQQAPDMFLDFDGARAGVMSALATHFGVDATALARTLFGDTILSNVVVLGAAYQQGLLPLSAAALEEALRLNGANVERNLAAFGAGRAAAAEPGWADEILAKRTAAKRPIVDDLGSVVARNAEFLTAYQDARYAERYRALVRRAEAAEAERNWRGFALAVARSYAKLLAYKDEYEVARLHLSPEFSSSLDAQFEGGGSLTFHLAPPLFPRRDAQGRLSKVALPGRVMIPVFRLLKLARKLRGTPLDLFGRTQERRTERALIALFEADVSAVLARPDISEEYATSLAALPLEIRGFGHVKDRSVAAFHERREALLRNAKGPVRMLAAE
jgi:indolepyruvate ferredoxin oxidoreductase